MTWRPYSSTLILSWSCVRSGRPYSPPARPQLRSPARRGIRDQASADALPSPGDDGDLTGQVFHGRHAWWRGRWSRVRSEKIFNYAERNVALRSGYGTVLGRDPGRPGGSPGRGPGVGPGFVTGVTGRPRRERRGKRKRTGARPMTDVRVHAPRPAPSGSPDWRDHAACRDTDPELFFPVGNAGPALVQLERAKQVCAGCKVRTRCLEWALASGQEAGVWGGAGEDERRALRRRRQHR
jgi:WhiB family redox-sensing transcriptional regulator